MAYQTMRPLSRHFAAGSLMSKHGIYEEYQYAKHRLGERLDLGDRTFFYASAGEALNAGNTVEGALYGGAGSTLQTTLGITVAALAGDKRIYVNALTTEQTKNVFADGYVSVFDATTTGLSWLFRIKGNSTLATSGTSSFLELYDELPITLTITTDQLEVIGNMYKSVKQGNTTQAGPLLGVAPITVQSGYFFWLQTYGPAAVYPGVAAFVIDEYVGLSDTTAGAAETITGIASGVCKEPALGYTLHPGTVSEAGIVFLTVRK